MANKARQAHIAARRAQAIQLRLSGVDWDTIADRLGYSGKAAACKDVSRALDVAAKAAARAGEDLRRVELARLERLQAALWADALRGDAKAADTVLRIMERRARLLGLDAPKKIETDGSVRYVIEGVSLDKLT